MTSRIPKRTKSVSQPAHDVNPAQVYHALESLGLFKSKAGRSISQADVQSLCTGSFGIVLDFLSSHLLGEVEVNQRRSAIASLYEDIQDEATLEEIFPPDTTVGSYRQIESKLKHQRVLKEQYDVQGVNLEGKLKQHEDSTQGLLNDYSSINGELFSIRQSFEEFNQQLQAMRNLQTLVEKHGLSEGYLDSKLCADDALLPISDSVSNYETKVRQLLPPADFAQPVSVLQAIQNAIQLSGEIKTRSPPQGHLNGVEETLIALEAIWLKLWKSAAGSSPGTPDQPTADGDQGSRQQLSEENRERLRELARSRVRRRLVTAVNSACRSGAPSISRFSEVSERNVASMKEATELIGLSKTILPETRRMALLMREDVRNHSATILPLLEQVPGSTNEYIQESLRTNNPQPKAGT